MSHTFFNRRLRHSLFVVPLVVSLLSWMAPARAAEPDASMPDSQLDDTRYQMRRDGEGIIRLDRKTGTVSRCQTRGASVVCRLAADERAVLEEEIASLQAEIDALKSSRTNDEADDGGMPDKQPENGDDLKSENGNDRPDEKELNRVLDYSTTILRRFFTVMKELRNELNE